MATEYLDLHLSLDGYVEAWCEAKISYDYEPGEPDSRHEPGWPAEANNVLIEFRHPAPKGKPDFPWAANPFLEQLLDIESLRDWLCAQYEGAAEEYAFDRADHLYELASERRYMDAAE